jgi:hypothetical protein
VLAIITAGLLSTAHIGSAPAINLPGANAPTVVFDRPAPAPAKTTTQPVPQASAEPPGFVCYQLNVDAALNPKHESIANGDVHSAAASCQRLHPPHA